MNRVLLTGHTGFKGAWLSLWLSRLGAEIHGFSLAEDPAPAAYTALGVRGLLASERIADVRDAGAFADTFERVKPDLVFHLAAQSLVRESYRHPYETLEVNVMGTARVLEALRASPHAAAAVFVTSDKCYEDPASPQPHVEEDAMGGHDVYSMSKGACELVIASYRRSFLEAAGKRVATARAGNVIGGGDYSTDRLVPDCVRSVVAGKPIAVRHPNATRPWQHVLEPLSGYLELGRRLLGPDGASYAEAWNFGPSPIDTREVRDVVTAFVAGWGSGSWEPVKPTEPLHEAFSLRLSIEKASRRLDWRPTWEVARAISETVAWYKRFESGPKTEGCMREASLAQIAAFETSRGGRAG